MSDLPATPAFTPRAAVKHAIIYNGEASDVDTSNQLVLQLSVLASLLGMPS